MNSQDNFFEEKGKQFGSFAGQVVGIDVGNKVCGTTCALVGPKIFEPVCKNVGGTIGKVVDAQIKRDQESFKNNYDFAESKGLTNDQCLDYALEQTTFY